MNRKVGPLPLWVWIGAAAAVMAVVYLRARSSGGLAPVSDPTAGGGAGGPTDLSSGMPSTSPTSAGELPDLTPTVSSEGPPAGSAFDPGTGLPLDIPDIPDPQTIDLTPPAILAPIAKVAPKTVSKISGRAGRRAPKHRVTHSKHRVKAKPKAKTPGVRKGHRAPAHGHEHVHAPAPSHLREQPAHTRFRAPAPRPAHPQHPTASPHAPGHVPAPAGRPRATPRPSAPHRSPVVIQHVRQPANPSRPNANPEPVHVRTVTPRRTPRRRRRGR